MHIFYDFRERGIGITFQIISSKGELIFNEEFPVYALFVYGNPSYMYYIEKK